MGKSGKKMEKILELKNINKKYGEKKVLENFSFIFPQSGFVAVKGKNGSGKTTILNIIMGLEKPDSGEVIFDSHCLYLGKKNQDKAKKPCISVVFQEDRLLEHCTVMENILFVHAQDNCKSTKKRRKTLYRCTPGNMDGKSPLSDAAKTDAGPGCAENVKTNGGPGCAEHAKTDAVNGCAECAKTDAEPGCAGYAKTDVGNGCAEYGKTDAGSGCAEYVQIDYEKKALEILAALGLKGEEHSPVSSLSGGMKRRVAIARCLDFDADIYIMDEPTNGLDEEIRRQTLDVIHKMTDLKGKLLIMVSHNPEDSTGCTKLLEIKNIHE